MIGSAGLGHCVRNTYALFVQWKPHSSWLSHVCSKGTMGFWARFLAGVPLKSLPATVFSETPQLKVHASITRPLPRQPSSIPGGQLISCPLAANCLYCCTYYYVHIRARAFHFPPRHPMFPLVPGSLFPVRSTSNVSGATVADNFPGAA